MAGKITDIRPSKGFPACIDTGWPVVEAVRGGAGRELAGKCRNLAKV